MKGTFHILLKISLLFLLTLSMVSSRVLGAKHYKYVYHASINKKKASLLDSKNSTAFISENCDFESADGDVSDADDQSDNDMLAGDLYHFASSFLKRITNFEVETLENFTRVAALPRYILFHSLIIPSAI